MARTKAKGPTLEPATWYYHPAPADLAGAGFKPDPGSPLYLWHWCSQDPEPRDRVGVMVSLLPRTGEVFIYSSRHGATPPHTLVTTRAQFGALLKRYGWKPQPRTLHLEPTQSQAPPLELAA